MAIDHLGNHAGKKATETIVFSPIQILIFWTLRNGADGHISSSGDLCKNTSERKIGQRFVQFFLRQQRHKG